MVAGGCFTDNGPGHMQGHWLNIDLAPQTLSLLPNDNKGVSIHYFKIQLFSFSVRTITH